MIKRESINDKKKVDAFSESLWFSESHMSLKILSENFDMSSIILTSCSVSAYKLEGIFCIVVSNE